MVPAKCDTDLLLQQNTRMCFDAFKVFFPLWRGISENFSQALALSGGPDHMAQK